MTFTLKTAWSAPHLLRQTEVAVGACRKIPNTPTMHAQPGTPELPEEYALEL